MKKRFLIPSLVFVFVLSLTHFFFPQKAQAKYWVWGELWPNFVLDLEEGGEQVLTLIAPVFILPMPLKEIGRLI